LRVPVIRNGAVVFVISAVITPEGLTHALRMASGPDEWVRVLLDAHNVIYTWKYQVTGIYCKRES
jgi:hypothetical protein